MISADCADFCGFGYVIEIAHGNRLWLRRAKLDIVKRRKSHVLNGTIRTGPKITFVVLPLIFIRAMIVLRSGRAMALYARQADYVGIVKRMLIFPEISRNFCVFFMAAFLVFGVKGGLRGLHRMDRAGYIGLAVIQLGPERGGLDRDKRQKGG